MARYSIVFKKSVAKDLHLIPKEELRGILKQIDSLVHNSQPAGAEKLSGDDKYRIRQGKYRILYFFENEIRTGTIAKVGLRHNVSR
jgi:mRNA interferase RelE/StbE